MDTQLLQDVAQRLQAIGILARVEYPGFVAISFRDGKTREGDFAFGTANGRWGGDFVTYSGETVWADTLAVSPSETDATRIAIAIVTALLENS